MANIIWVFSAVVLAVALVAMAVNQTRAAYVLARSRRDLRKAHEAFEMALLQARIAHALESRQEAQDGTPFVNSFMRVVAPAKKEN